MTSQSPSLSPTLSSRKALIAPAAVGVAFLWAFWPTFVDLAHHWSSDTENSHGYLVPVFAAYLLWMRRAMIAKIAPGSSSPRWGLALLALGVLVRFAGDYLYMDWLDAASLLPCLVGITLLLGGKPALLWAWPSILFLVFMMPMPFTVRTALANPLRRVATLVSTYILQTLGLTALADGNTILLGESQLGVEEACSGLSMLVTFFALSVAFVFVMDHAREADRPDESDRLRWWEKVLLVLSAIPIALIANITRITVTGIMHETVGHKAADVVFHDLAGWLMMPYALALLWLEMWVLSRLFVEVEAPERTVKVPTETQRVVAAYKGKSRRHAKKQPFFPPLPHGPKKS